MSTSALAADNSVRAADAYNAMQAAYYQPSTRLYREHYPHDPAQDNPNGYLWSFEEAAKATLSVYGTAGASATYAQAIRDRSSARERYWDGVTRQRGYRSYPETGDRYFDDNCWVGSDLLQHHLLTSESAKSTALDRAKGVFRYVQTGWTTTLPKPGGVRWVDAAFNGDRATDSTGGWSKLGAHVYDVTGRRTHAYLDSALMAYSWTQQSLLAPNGLYGNSVRADGTVDATQWIYNQGIMIGAGVLLHRVTGHSVYLADSVRLADAALAFYATDAYYSGTMGAYSGRGIFNAIFFRNLLMLYAVNHNATYLHAMQAYADAVSADPKVHDPATNFYQLNGEPRRSLLDQAAMVQVFALLSWDAGKYALLT
jgi:hypothetical protein